jgi:hypothetical protein
MDAQHSLHGIRLFGGLGRHHRLKRPAGAPRSCAPQEREVVRASNAKRSKQRDEGEQVHAKRRTHAASRSKSAVNDAFPKRISDETM